MCNLEKINTFRKSVLKEVNKTTKLIRLFEYIAAHLTLRDPGTLFASLKTIAVLHRLALRESLTTIIYNMNRRLKKSLGIEYNL